MSVRLPEHESFENDYDNSDLVMDRNVQDVASGYSHFDELLAYKSYLETLKLESELESSDKKIKIPKFKANGEYDLDANQRIQHAEFKVSNLVGRKGEFESKRRLILMKLNTLSDTEIKKRLAEYECQSIFSLSNKITNSIIDKSRRDAAFDAFNIGSMSASDTGDFVFTPRPGGARSA